MSALLPKPVRIGPSIPAAPMLRFAEFCGSRKFSNFKTAWNEFRRLDKRITKVTNGPVSYNQIVYYFRGGWFKGLQTRLKAVEQAQIELARFRLALTAELRRRLPDKPQRKRRSGAELSREASGL